MNLGIKLLGSIFFFLLHFNKVVGQTIQSKAIVWSDVKLTWENFQKGGQYKQRATTYWMLLVKDPEVSAPDSILVQVKALFIPELSYANPSRPKEDYILEHEQIHFDIVEVMAREMRKELLGTVFYKSKWKRQLDQIKRKTLSKIRKMQSQFHEQTNNGYDRKMHEEWKQLISRKMLELKDHAEPEIRKPLCDCK